MPLVEIIIQNFKGIKAARLTFGKRRTVISGANGKGKSALLEAVTATFEGGYDEKLVRNPEAEGAACITMGEVPVEKKPLPETKAVLTLKFADGSYAKRVIDKERRTSSVEAYSADGQKLGGQGYLEELATAATISPIRFLLAEGKDRAKIVMEFLTVPLEPEELDFIPEGRWWLAKATDHKGKFLPCFDALKEVETACVERRREINRRADELAKTANNLRGRDNTLNDETRDWERESREATEKHRDAVAACRMAEIQVTEEAEAAEKEAASERATAYREAEIILQGEIEKLKARMEIKKVAAEKSYSDRMAAIAQARRQAEATVEAEHGPNIEATREDMTVAAGALKRYNETQGLRVHLKEVEQDHREVSQKAGQFDRAIDKLRRLRETKMEEVPIPGLSMKDGVVFYEGLPLDALNTAKRIEVATQLCTAASRKEALLVIDDAEHLDSQTRQDFYEALARAGFQVLAAEVTDGPLKVVTA